MEGAAVGSSRTDFRFEYVGICFGEQSFVVFMTVHPKKEALHQTYQV